MPRYFTLEEATALLPRLAQILGEMQEGKHAHDRLRDDLAGAVRKSAGNGLLLERELADKRKAVEEAGRRLEDLLAQVREMGCELKGIEEGLIDFPAQREGRPVYLCWRLGEEAIAYWHEMDAGFAGRQPLSP